MTLRLVVMEDMGTRPRTLTAICKATATPGGARFADLAPEDWLMIPPDIAEFGPADLATVDGIFVDFDLQPDKNDGHTEWAPFELSNGVTFAPTTGMSVLLHARTLMETPEYHEARAAYLQTLTMDERRWAGPSGSTRLFSFVNTHDAVSRLFVAAASSWFGATYFMAQPRLSSPDGLRDAVRHLRAAVDEPLRWDRQARKFRSKVAPALDHLLSVDVRGRGQQLIPDAHEWPLNFDLMRVYLAHNGKSEFGSYKDAAGFRDAVYEVCGIRLEPRTLPKESTDSVYFRMQEALEAFHVTTEVNPVKWPSWDGLSRGADAMLDYLQRTRLFWQSDDVRIAHLEHMRRTEQAQ